MSSDDGAGTGQTDERAGQRAEDEVVTLCGDLIRIDSSNPTSNERAAAEHVAALLAEVGLEPTITESEPGRTSLVARFEGQDPGRGALLVHHHLDVVPADPTDWSVHPFSGEVADGYLWGRGAVDMKNSVAATLAVVRQMRRTGRRPRRDLVLAFNADEEAGGHYGVKHVVAKHRELFDGCTEAIGEVGGFSTTVADDLRLYLVQAAERGQAWMRLTARGTAGHGSMRNDDNPVTKLAEAITRLGRHRFDARLVPAGRDFLIALADAHGVSFEENDPEALLPLLGPLAKMIDSGLRHSVNPTMLEAGYKLNVVPERAVGYADGRFLPGLEDDFLAQVDKLLGDDVTREWVHHDIAVETDFGGELTGHMAAALVAEDPGARVVPFCMSGATDAKSYAPLGIRCYGFTPLRLPADLDFAGLFHGVDERVPLDALRFSVRVLDRFLTAC